MIWERDTAAILEDYRETCDATLPVGESFTILDVVDGVAEGQAICSLDRERELLDALIPRDRQNKIAFFRLPTPYVIAVPFTALAEECIGPLAAAEA